MPLQSDLLDSGVHSRVYLDEGVQRMRIGQVAKLTALSIDTLRFYEQQGLIRPRNRSAAGYREYSKQVIEQLRLIKEAQNCGFRLREIGELFALHIDTQTCDILLTKATEKLVDIEATIRHLQTVRRTLKKVMRNCQERPSTKECSTVKSLQQAEYKSKRSQRIERSANSQYDRTPAF
jgi:DNA-binding transcriptional MerR regulator